MSTHISDNLETVVDGVIDKIGKDLVVGTPLGAGKANNFLNALYLRAKGDPSISLTILTALTLQKPAGKSDLEKRFMGPMAERVFGNYPDLEYELDRVADRLPSNIRVIEFYLPPGKFAHHSGAQRNYLSTNYTHAGRDVINRGVNVICQQVCSGEIDGEKVYSLSCNPDITIDIANKVREQGKPMAVVGQVNENLPFMYGESVVGESFFDFIVDNRELDFKVFGPPKMSVSDADYMIGFHASTLIKDDGEIQIGIGSLGDALVYSLIQRHKNNETYKKIMSDLEISSEVYPVIDGYGGTGTFEKGLFAATEMFVDCFANLFEEGILKKKVYDSVVLQRLLNEEKIKEEFGPEILDVLMKEKAIHYELSREDFDFLREFGIFRKDCNWSDGKIIAGNGEQIDAVLIDRVNREKIEAKVLGDKLRNGAVAHAGFFLGHNGFYQFLRDLPVEKRKLIRMKKISQINQLYGHEQIDRLQRKNGRFVNTCMKVTLNGSACSDALENNTQVSGVGGQYNFVSMAHELEDGRSILQLRSWRHGKGGRPVSNIVFNYGNCTIPRHLRDIVITEYGIADLRGKTDEEVAIQLIQISDSRFQSDLLHQAIAAGKVDPEYRIPSRFTSNFPHRYESVLKKLKGEGLFPAFPFGADFTEEEMKVGKTLKLFKRLSLNKASLIMFILKSLLFAPMKDEYLPLLKRMGLDKTTNFKEKLFQKMLRYGFSRVLS